MFIYVDENDHQTYITFASKAPHKTRMLLISYMVDDKPAELINTLEQAGWAESRAEMLPLFPAPPLHGRVEVALHVVGSAVFGYWTDNEARVNMAICRKVLRKFDFMKVPHLKLTLADMM